MAGTRRVMMNGRISYQSFTAGRPIPKRGNVKVAILVCLAHSVASIFSHSSRRAVAHLA